MWLIFGGKTKAKRVPGGREVAGVCPDCHARTTFVEAEVNDKLELFFIEVAAHTTRRLICSECGEDFDLERLPAAGREAQRPTRASSVPATASAPQKAESSRLTGARKPVSESEKDEMLRALKRKMGRT